MDPLGGFQFDLWDVPDLVDMPFDFDSFLNSDFADFPAADSAAHVPPACQQYQAPASPAPKKRRLSSAAQPYKKKKSIKNNHVCNIHPSPTTARCFGKWSKAGPYRGARCDRRVATFVDGELPVCTQHKTQVMDMVFCAAVLSCGFPCNEIVPWKQHGYRLCEAHWSQGKCWFLALPVEARLMIYQYLIPDRPVPARSPKTLMFLRDDFAPVSTAIFRVNKTIHEEYADLFYGQTTFCIDVSNINNEYAFGDDGIYMCCAKDKFNLLQGFEMQLQMLQQQNRLRLRRAREAAGAAAGGGIRPSRPGSRNLLATGVKYDFKPWEPSLSPRYFQRIRSFRINITFDTPMSMSIGAGNGSENTQAILTEAKRNLLCDYLHRLVERLAMNNQIPLQKLDIGFRIQGIADADSAQANSQSIAHCKALTKPLRRLRTRSARIVSMARIRMDGEETDMLATSLESDGSIRAFVQSCSAELTNSLAPSTSVPVLVRFGQLTQIISQMSQHPYWRDTDIEEMEFLLDNGRSAREANDMKAMKLILGDVLEMLKKYNSSHKDFMKQMTDGFENLRSNGK